MEKTTENYKLDGKMLNIITYPDPVLTTKAVDVTEFGASLQELCKNMLFTMYHAPGIGLAAPQVGISKRIFVIDVDYSREEIEEGSEKYTLSDFNPLVFINPIITGHDGQTTYEEGCLSLPGIYENVKRYDKITVEYKDTEGKPQSMDAQELLSICVQHENDHLDGIVFIDRLSNLKKSFLKKKLFKAKQKQSL